MENITGDGLKVENMLYVYKQLKNPKYPINISNMLGYFEACVQNFTPIYEDAYRLKSNTIQVLCIEIPYKTIFGKTKYRKETYRELLLRYAENFFIKNNINFSLKVEQ